MKRAALYARVSSKEQTEGYSLDAQQKAMRDYCAQHDMTVSVEFVEPGESARSDNRPAFQDMISHAKKHEFDAIVVHKLDRFARNREDAVVYKGLLKREGIRVISVTEQFDDGPMGTLVEGFMECIAEWYSANLGQETKKGLHERHEQGGQHGGIIAYGYQRLPDGTIEVVEEDAAIVREIFTRAARESESPHSIAALLNQRGVKTRENPQGRNPQRQWAGNTIVSLLRNKFYIGLVSMNGKTACGHHQRIISDELWAMVHSTIKLRGTHHGRFRAKHVYELSSLLRCAVCGRLFSGTTIDRQNLSYYRDQGWAQAGVCKTRHIPTNVLNSKINSIFDTLPIDAIKQRIRDGVLVRTAPVLPDKVDNDITRNLLFLLKRGEVSQQEYLDGIEDERKKLALAPEPAVNVEKVLALLDVPRDFWSRATPEERRERNRIVFEEILIQDREIVDVTFTPPLDTLLKYDVTQGGPT